MNILKEEDNFPITHCYHLADVHFRKTLGHEAEYREVFKKLCDNIKKDKEDPTLNPVLFIAGDIMHAKNSYNDTSNALFCDIMEDLRTLLPVFLVLGNHDSTYNSRTKQSKESISHLVKYMPNVFLMLKSGHFQYKNIVWSVSSVWDNKIVTNDIDVGDKINIGTYHGMVKGSKINPNLPSIKNGPDFVNFGFDVTMLGDIHQLKYLSPTCAYPSSTICQNYGEHPTEHGYILWDIQDKHNIQSKFIGIPNDYAHITINIENNEVKSCPEKPLPKKARVRVISYDSSKEFCEDVIKKLVPNPSKKSIEYRTRKVNPIIKLLDDSDTENIFKLETQLNCMKKYATDELKLTDKKLIDDILTLHKEIYDENPIEPTTAQKWQILKIQWSNMFNYGENNIIDFETHPNEVMSVCAPNYYGKSSIIDIILFTLFATCSRGSTNKDIMNRKKTNFVASMEIKLNNKIYKIIRGGYVIKENTCKLPTSLRLQIKDKNGDFIDISGKNEMSKTTKILRTLFGTYDNYKKTIVKLQEDDSFIKDSASKKFDFLMQLRNINFFNSYVSSINSRIKNVSELQTISNDRVENNTEDSIQVEIDEKQKEFTSITDKYTNTQQKINDLHKTLYKLYSDFDNNVPAKITNEHQCAKNLKNKILILSMKEKLASSNNKCDIQMAHLNINNTKNKINDLVEQQEILTPLVNISNMGKYINISNQIKMLENNIYHKCQYIIKIKNHNICKLEEISRIKLLVQIEQKNLENINKKIKKIHENIKIKALIKKWEREIEIRTINLDRVHIRQMNCNAELENLKNYKKIVMDHTQKLNEYSYKQTCYNIYKKIVSKKGLPYILIIPVLQLLEENVNNTLNSGLADFTVKIDSKLSDTPRATCPIISIKKISDDIHSDILTCSGFEKAITSMSFRLGLIKASKTPYLDMLMIDEGFSNADSDNLSNIPILFDIFRQNFQNSLIITHLDVVKGSTDCQINIKKNNHTGFSKVNIYDGPNNTVEKELKDCLNMFKSDNENNVLVKIKTDTKIQKNIIKNKKNVKRKKKKNPIKIAT